MGRVWGILEDSRDEDGLVLTVCGRERGVRVREILGGVTSQIPKILVFSTTGDEDFGVLHQRLRKFWDSSPEVMKIWGFSTKGERDFGVLHLPKSQKLRGSPLPPLMKFLEFLTKDDGDFGVLHPPR